MAIRVRPLATRRVYLKQVFRATLVAGALIGVSLAVGVLGYHGFEQLPWIDALLNAAMIMGGMGPVDPLHSVGGKLFASAYALYCGLLLLVSAGILLAPLLKRFLHRFHLEMDRPD